MADQAPDAQLAYCPAQFDLVKSVATAACQLDLNNAEANSQDIRSAEGQSTSMAADRQIKQTVRLPDAPLAIRKMPFPSAVPARAAPGVHAAKAPHQSASVFKEQPALPLRPAPSGGPAWKRVVRSAPMLTKKDDSPLLSRLAKLTNATGTPVTSGHVAGVVPPECWLPSHSLDYCLHACQLLTSM